MTQNVASLPVNALSCRGSLNFPPGKENFTDIKPCYIPFFPIKQQGCTRRGNQKLQRLPNQQLLASK